MSEESTTVSLAFSKFFTSHYYVRDKNNKVRYLQLSTIVLACVASVLYFSTFFTKNKVSRRPTTVRINTDVGLLHDQKDMLDNEQLSRLNNITSGLLTRENVEVIISRHNEDISWSDMYASIRTVYEKSDELNVLKVRTPGNVVRLANLGRESHTYLTHIVNNYGTLAELTVFSQGSAPGHGYDGHRKGGGHVLANSTFHDFVLNERGHFIFTGAIWLRTLAHLLRTGK
jgi:hypothetical protein